MDMKKILQAMDGAATKPVQGASDMARFVSIVTEGKDTKTNRQSTAEQMITQGYTTMSTVPTLNKKPAKESVIGKYFDEVLAESTELAEAKKEKTKAIAKKIADKLKKKSVEEGHYRRPGSPHAYDRDVRASQSGMGHKDSLAYQQDGGANDEGWGEEPYQHKEDKPRLLGYYFYDVQPGQEDAAAQYGVKKTKSGKWAKAKYSTSGRSFGMQKDMADKEFGHGKWWEPKAKMEATDTVERDADGKVKSWKHEGDWKKSTGKDARGRVTNMSDKARRETEKKSKDVVEGDEKPFVIVRK